MKYLLIILTLWQGIPLQSQEVDQIFDEFIIVTASKLSIRSAPDINSEQIGFANYGEWVKVLDLREADSHLVEVNGKLDSWAEIEYNGLKGYMFGHYLAKNSLIKVPNSNWDENYLILSEHRRLKELTYSSQLKWYGIYTKEDGEYIEEVDVSIEYIPEKEHPELELENHLKVKTSKSLKSTLLIGTNKPMKTGYVGIKIPTYYKRKMHNNIKLPLPFMIDSCRVNNDYFIIGENSTNDTNQCFLENYKVTLCKDNNDRIEEIFDFEDLVEALVGEGRDGCNIPSLYWYGDLNNDTIPDLVFYTAKNNFGKCKLYLSKKINGKIKYDTPVVLKPIFHMG